MSVWVLTSERNEYDQYGEYFEHAWPYKPTKEELSEHLSHCYHRQLDFIYSGGGREKDTDYEWFHFYEVK